MNDTNRFQKEDAREILERAAAEQHRLDDELADTYSLEELEEMAAEAGISPEALRVAMESPVRQPDTSTSDNAIEPDQRPRGWLTLSRMPEHWSPAVRATVVTSAVGIVLFGALFAFPVVAPVLFWVTIVLLLLILLGAFPV